MDQEVEDVILINEHQTRKKYIDPELEKIGWHKKYIKEEVNSVKSDFNNNNLIFFNGNVERGKDRFIDYILCNNSCFRRNPTTLSFTITKIQV